MNIRQIRRRIRSLTSTARITKAMEMVAASKMRRAQLRVLAGRPFAEKITDMLAHLAAQRPTGDVLHPLLETRPAQKVAVVHITADRGLCGGFNGNINRRTATFLLEEAIPTVLITVGRKGRDFMSRYGRELRAEFTNLGDRPSLVDTLPISHVVIEDYTTGLVDRVYLAYNRFVSTMIQRPVLEPLLPVDPGLPSGKYLLEYIYEPDASTVLTHLLPRYVEMKIYHALLESIASEQSARMVAMRNATQNANEMIEDLTFVFNKARQEAITKEILDIAGGAAALT